MKEYVFLNGNLVPSEKALISPLDYGFLYGLGIFETMRAYGGKVFQLDKHIARVTHNAEALGIQIGTDLKSAVTSLLEANRLADARVRITVSGGEGKSLPETADFPKPTILIAANSYQPYPEEVYEKGFKAIISAIRRNSQSPLPRLKSTNYLESLLAKQEAKKKGADEAIFLNERDLVAEACTSNIFIVSEGVLKTPRVENGILPGVTREIVLELAPKHGIETVEQDIWLGELLEADEALLTNSMFEVMPLVGVAGKRIGNGKAGVITKRLQASYRATADK